jgi:transketolase
MEKMQEITLAEALFPPQTPQNSPATPTQLSMEARRQQVITLLLQQEEVGKIARKLGVDRKTIYTDFEAWAKTEQATHLQIEWLQQYESMKQENPEEAFQALTKLMMKLLEKQAKLEVNVTQNSYTQIDITKQIDELIEVSELPCNGSSSPDES